MFYGRSVGQELRLTSGKAFVKHRFVRAVRRAHHYLPVLGGRLPNKHVILKCILSVLICTHLLFPAVATPNSAVDEFRLKIAFMWKFLQFSEWKMQESPMKGELHPWRICFSDETAHRNGAALLRGKRFKDQPVLLLVVKPTDVLDQCHILFVSQQDNLQFDLSKIAPSVLTIGESDAFIGQGGLIEFVVKKRRLRFKINREKIRASDIRIDARVLRLAVNVEDGR